MRLSVPDCLVDIPEKLSLRSSTVHSQFIVAVALLSLLPLLGLRLFLEGYAGAFSFHLPQVIAIHAVMLSMIALGYAGYRILRNCDVSLTRLRGFLEYVHGGGDLEAIDLSATSADFAVIQSDLNEMIDRLRGDEQTVSVRTDGLREIAGICESTLRRVAEVADRAKGELTWDSPVRSQLDEIRATANNATQIVRDLMTRQS
jgi:methyl-accepting chemotaxis protein